MASLDNIMLLCEDPNSLAEFWAGTLECELEEPPPELIEVIEAERDDFNAATVASNPPGDGPRLSCTRMPRSLPEHIPIHLTVDDREVEVERLTELGASIVETKTGTTGPYSLFFTCWSSQENMTIEVVVYRKAATNPADRAVLARSLSVLTMTDTQIADGGGVSLAQRSPQNPGETA